MKLIVETRMSAITNKDIEVICMLNDGQTQHVIREVIPDELMKDRKFISRTIDKMFYEMKIMVSKHFAIKDIV